VTILDVRPADEFPLGHLPGAVNIPLRKLEARLSVLKRSSEIVAYCRGPYCVLSYEAVAALRKRGYKARAVSKTASPNGGRRTPPTRPAKFRNFKHF
jgi:rhodanese-related sulfurtransferase